MDYLSNRFKKNLQIPPFLLVLSQLFSKTIIKPKTDTNVACCLEE